MQEEYEYAAPCDDIQSPRDIVTNTEVLYVCASSRHSGDQMEDYCEKEVVLDSDDEEGNQNEAVNWGTGRFPIIGRLSGRNATGLLRRQQVPTGCFHRVDNKVGEHVLLDSARGERSDGETSHYNDNRFQKNHVVADCVVPRSPQQNSIPLYPVDPDLLNPVRESFTVESLDERNLFSHESKSMDREKGANYGCKLAELNYAQSPGAAESQDKAIRFVDHFLSVSDLGSYENIETRKTNMTKSPPSLRSKGSQSLAMRVSLGSSASKFKAFDWAEKQIEKGEYTSVRMNNDSIFGFKDDKSDCLLVNQESDNGKLHNKISNLQSKEEIPGNISSLFDLSTDSLNSIDSDNIGSNSGIHVVYDSMEFDKQHEAGLSRQTLEKVEQFSLVPDALDIGLDTQMAVEAMEELIHAVPPTFDARFTHQALDKPLLDNKCQSNHVADYEDTCVSWRSKGKRSKCMKISTIQDKRSSKDFQKHHYLCRRRSKETANGVTCGPSLKLRNMCSFHDDIHTCLKSDCLSFQLKKGRTITEKNSNMNVADRTFSNLNLWVYPKGKRTRQRTQHHSVGASNECSPSLAIDRNVEKYITVNEEAYKGAPKLLVYKRQRKISLGRDQTGSSLGLAVDFSSSVSDKTVSDKQVSIGSDTGKSLIQCALSDDWKSSSLDASSNMKSNSISDEHSMTVQALEGSDRRKQPSNPFSRSPLMAELTRLGYTGSLPDFLPKGSRRRSTMNKVCILFSQNLEKGTLKQQKKIVVRLGLSIASSCSNATHFVADRFVRTRNMLEAIALGKPVVTHLWLESCEQAGCIINEKSFILRDEKKEKEIGFNMSVALSRASKLPLLKGRRVLITPNVKPGIDVISTLVKAVQGEVVQNIPTTNTKDKLIPDDFLVISCKEDYKISLQFLEKGGSIYDSELLLNGILTQKLDYYRYQL